MPKILAASSLVTSQVWQQRKAIFAFKFIGGISEEPKYRNYFESSTHQNDKSHPKGLRIQSV
jgi:hypothetical protein